MSPCQTIHIAAPGDHPAAFERASPESATCWAASSLPANTHTPAGPPRASSSIIDQSPRCSSACRPTARSPAAIPSANRPTTLADWQVRVSARTVASSVVVRSSTRAAVAIASVGRPT